MATAINCSCGYRGPGVTHEGRSVCPICRTPGESRQEVLRILCPNGHVLPVSAALVGQRLVCPKCNASFVPSADDSVDRRRELERLRAEREEQRARDWLARAMWAAIIVVLLVVLLGVLNVVRS